jgi:hypothetical protein
MDLESRGVPGGFVASEVFIEAAAAQAKALGFDPLKVFVPHPIQDRTDEEMREMADKYFHEVMAMVVDSNEPPG